jgi:glycosyltransferase involved in cell wall biosynthesis
MNIMFVSYWGIEEGLTASTVIPHLRILNDIEEVDAIFFYTIERGPAHAEITLPQKVRHIPLKSSTKYLSKISDFIRFPRIMQKAVIKHQVQLMFCRGAPAGALGYLVHRLTRVEYVVESFEPHALYMAESGVWHKWGLRFHFQRYWEARQMETARYLLPVSHTMKSNLLKRGVPVEKIFVMPCAVNTNHFVFSVEHRRSIRQLLHIPDECIVGIYVGKFGGLYYDKEAFEIFHEAMKFFQNFRIIILTPNDKTEITDKMARARIPEDAYHVLKTAHDEVPAFLSAADLAFGFFKPSPSIKFSSAIKIGEYWAVGLPVFIPEGIGDDSAIVENEKLGTLFRLSGLNEAFKQMQALLQQDRNQLRHKIRNLAFQHRSFSTNNTIYRKIFNELRHRKGTRYAPQQ